MINIDPKSWHARLYLWYMKSLHGRLQARALQGTYLCPYMRTLLIWIPLYITLALPFRLVVRGLYRFVIKPLYLLLWGGSDWHFRPRWIWLGLLIGAPLLTPPIWQYQDGWAWWSGLALGFAGAYILILVASVVAAGAIFAAAGFLYWWVDADGKATSYRELSRTGRAVVIITRPIAVPTYGFARLLYKYYQTFHTKICPRVQFMEPEAWEEE